MKTSKTEVEDEAVDSKEIKIEVEIEIENLFHAESAKFFAEHVKR